MQRNGIVWMCLLYAAIQLTSCKSSSPDEMFEVHYFPDRNVYYSPVKNFYYYSVNAGKTWDSLPANFDVETTLLGNKTILQTNNDRFYLDNPAHREKYSGIVYNLYSSGDPAGKASAVTERKTAKKTTIETGKKPEETEKKGLKKFFNKIFGKKKKNPPSD